MNQQIQLRSVVLGSVLGTAIVLAVGAATQTTTPTYEYKFLYQTIAQSQDIEVQLNTAATQGWEAVGYAIDAGSRHVLLKRVKK